MTFTQFMFQVVYRHSVYLQLGYTEGQQPVGLMVTLFEARHYTFKPDAIDHYQ